MAPSASAEQVRRAYLDRARALHPDRFVAASPDEARRAARAMQDVNEAWRVLRDPARRVAYDRSIATTTAPGRTVPTAPPRRPDPEDDDLVDVAPPVGPGWSQVLRGLPWAVLLALLALIFVFTAYASRGTDDDLVGRCVAAVPSPTGTVPCDEPGARTVTAVVDAQRTCPPGDTRARWAQDGTAVCLSP